MAEQKEENRGQGIVSPIELKHPFIGLTGTNSAGKGEAAAFFMSRGYGYCSLSEVIRARLRVEGLEESRDNLIRRGNELRREGGPDTLARLAMAEITPPAVIDSIRNAGEIAFLKAQPGFLLLAIEAPVALRFERAILRGRNESAATLEEFSCKEDEERSARPEAQQLDACIRLADAIVVNDGTIEDLRRKLEAFL
jgi:dephospho-CoA kinase